MVGPLGEVISLFLPISRKEEREPHHHVEEPLALLPFFISGPDLGAWPDVWVSVEFLHAIMHGALTGF